MEFDELLFGRFGDVIERLDDLKQMILENMYAMDYGFLLFAFSS